MQRTDDCILEFTGFVNVEELAGAQRKLHAFVILLQLIVYLGGNKGSQLPLSKMFIFIQRLTNDGMLAHVVDSWWFRELRHALDMTAPDSTARQRWHYQSSGL